MKPILCVFVQQTYFCVCLCSRSILCVFVQQTYCVCMFVQQHIVCVCSYSRPIVCVCSYSRPIVCVQDALHPGHYRLVAVIHHYGQSAYVGRCYFLVSCWPTIDVYAITIFYATQPLTVVGFD